MPELGSRARDVDELCRLGGVYLDPWQLAVFDGATSLRNDTWWNPYSKRWEYKWAATEVGVVVSRQNGKGEILLARALAGLFLFGDRLIQHTAHQFDTAKEGFIRLKQVIEQTPEFDREISRMPNGHGEEGVELKNGQRLRFRSRTGSGGRGFTGDCLILDEAMILDADMVKALLPTLSARPNHQIWYTGSAGNLKSIHFGRVRRRGLLGHENPSVAEPMLAFYEWSAEVHDEWCPPDCTEHLFWGDPVAWAQANPSLNIAPGHHGLSYDTLATDYRAMDDSNSLHENFAMEHLGIGQWPPDGEGWLVIPEAYWRQQQDREAAIDGPYCLGIDSSPNRAYSSISAAGAVVSSHGKIGIEVTGNDIGPDYRPGTNWVPHRIRDIYNNPNHRKPEFVVIDPSTEARSFILELEAEGIEVKQIQAREYGEACGDMKSGIMPKGYQAEALYVHRGQGMLDTAVRMLAEREMQEQRVWSKKDSTADISPWVSATLAAWGFKNHLYQRTGAAPWIAWR